MSAKDTKVTKVRAPAKPALARSLLADVRELILQTRAGVARAVDSGLLPCIGMWGSASGRTS